jgi:hypothetical protein
MGVIMKVGVGLSMDQMLYEIHTTNFFVWFGGVCSWGAYY